MIARISLTAVLLAVVSAGFAADEQPAGPADLLFTQYRILFRDLLGRRCAFSPSCSHFGQQAVSRKGPLLGVMVALDRWTRCNSSALEEDDYVRGESGLISDPLDGFEEVTCWGRWLLPF